MILAVASAYGAWVCLLAPLAGFLAILLAGDRITRRQAGILSTASVFVGFAGAIDAFVRTLGGGSGRPRAPLDGLDVARSRRASRPVCRSSSTRSRS